MNCLQTCRENFYGNLCENKCDCNETQICHHACGCLQKVDSSKCQRTRRYHIMQSHVQLIWCYSHKSMYHLLLHNFHFLTYFIFSLSIAYNYINSSQTTNQVLCVICMLTKFHFVIQFTKWHLHLFEFKVNKHTNSFITYQLL